MTMASGKSSGVTIRVRVGDSEIEVTGPKSYVEKKIEEFLKKPPTSIGSPTASPVHEPMPVAEFKGKKISPAQFFKKYNPKTDNDRVLVAGFYLEQVKNLQNFTAAEVRDQIRDAKRNPPKNVNDSINQNVRKGLLMSAGDRDNKIAFVLTSDGEEQVAAMLNEANA
jgi:predicted metal-dependent hydrolase